MITRRAFVQISSIAVLAGTARGAFAETGSRYGVQLYTVRKQAEKNLPAVLKAVHDIGYAEVETYWNVYNHPAAELKRMIRDNGLAVHSGHFNYERLEQKLEYAAELGLHYVICPMLPKAMWTSLDGFKRAADQFNTWGEKIGKMGMQFGFHNHNYEFRRFGNTTGFEMLMSRADASLVCLEMDCYWIAQAGQDPVAMLNTLGKRVRLLHLKDRKPGFPATQQLNKSAEHFTPVGTGTIDWKGVLATARKLDLERLYVEQDSGDRPPLEELRISLTNLERIS